MINLTRTINEFSGGIGSTEKFIQFVDEWPTEYPVYRRKNWEMCIEFCGDKNGVSVMATKTDRLDQDNYEVSDYIGLDLTKEETKELIAFLQKTIGEDNVQN